MWIQTQRLGWEKQTGNGKWRYWLVEPGLEGGRRKWEFASHSYRLQASMAIKTSTPSLVSLSGSLYLAQPPPLRSSLGFWVRRGKEELEKRKGGQVVVSPPSTHRARGHLELHRPNYRSQLQGCTCSSFPYLRGNRALLFLASGAWHGETQPVPPDTC